MEASVKEKELQVSNANVLQDFVESSATKMFALAQSKTLVKMEENAIIKERAMYAHVRQDLWAKIVRQIKDHVPKNHASKQQNAKMMVMIISAYARKVLRVKTAIKIKDLVLSKTHAKMEQLATIKAMVIVAPVHRVSREKTVKRMFAHVQLKSHARTLPNAST